ncbi:MAG: DNA replication protein DnaC [Ruminococcaceae bacterium]|nr:DNA replication protein DnaC [Oscillospiraceae bacterium]
MAYSAEVIRRARARLDSAKNDRDSQNSQRLAAAYRQVPRLLEIDRQLRQSMAVAVQAAFSKGADVEAMVAQAKAENLSLQAERKALIAENFQPGYLDEAPICSRCGGSGYIGSTMCQCLNALCLEELKKELSTLSGVEESFDQFRLDYYPQENNIRLLMERVYLTCRRYAENFSEKSGNLLFSGDTGLGKTFLSACIARAVAERGYSVVYESAGHLFSRLERAKFDGDADARRESEKYNDCDLLIIDDLGTEMPGQFTTAALYTLINDRILRGKSTIISTNLNTEDLSYRYNSQITSRLRGNFQRLAFLGEDIRLKKNQISGKEKIWQTNFTP